MPDIKDQNEPRLVPFMPCLMIKGIIKDQALAFLQLPRLISDPERRPGDACERKLNPELSVGRTVVWLDMGTWGQCREHRVMVLPRQD